MGLMRLLCVVATYLARIKEYTDIMPLVSRLLFVVLTGVMGSTP